MASKSAESKQFWRRQHKNRAIQAFNNKCFICDNSFPNAAYDFHHINSDKKEFTFSSPITSSKNGWYKMRDELLKCVMLCANCHRIYHSEPNSFQIEEKIYFNMDYYEWDDIEYQINHQTGEKNCPNKKDLIYCSECGILKEHSSISGLCHICAAKKQRKVERPNKDDLKSLIRNNTFVDIGKQFGVHDNTIRKWCKTYNLPSTKREINNYSNQQWDNLII